jgi:hypothetical protein
MQVDGGAQNKAAGVVDVLTDDGAPAGGVGH